MTVVADLIGASPCGMVGEFGKLGSEKLEVWREAWEELKYEVEVEEWMLKSFIGGGREV